MKDIKEIERRTREIMVQLLDNPGTKTEPIDPALEAVIMGKDTPRLDISRRD